ncbi:MAG: hypothetical protein J6W04_02280 [Bacteroidales bacterium]|nr:hypothetical protein [Bacteroidales bacterium]
MKEAKALLKIVRPYYNDKTGKLVENAPEKVKEAYRQLDALMNEIVEDPDLFDNHPYFADKEKEKEWAKKNKK